jgi:hypothetical protein
VSTMGFDFPPAVEPVIVCRGPSAPSAEPNVALTDAASAPVAVVAASQLAFGRELDRSQLMNRNPPGAANFGSPGAGVIWSCSSSILFLEQSQQARA